MKRSNSNKNKNSTQKSFGQKIVEEAERRVSEAHKRGVAVFFGGKSIGIKPNIEGSF